MSQLRSTMEEHHQEAGKESKVKEGNKTSSYSTSLHHTIPSRERPEQGNAALLRPLHRGRLRMQR